MPIESVDPHPEPTGADAVGFKPATPGDWSDPDPLTVQEALDTLGAGAPATDVNAIHDNVASEISAITEKTTPVSADLLVIEDSASSNAKKRVQVGNLPGGGSGSMTTVKADGSQVGGADIVTLDFVGSNFTITETPDTEINVSIDTQTDAIVFALALG